MPYPRRARRPPAAEPQTSRCRFTDEKYGRCRRVATVGGFCRRCAALLELDLERGTPADRLLNDLDRFLAKGYKDPLLASIGAAFGGFIGQRIMDRIPPHMRGPAQVAAHQAQAAARARAERAQQGQQQRPPPPPPAAEPNAAQRLRDARTTMGFEFGDQISVEDVKNRKRELARVFHPDVNPKGAAHMKRVNAAADLLIADLEKKNPNKKPSP